MRVISGKYRGKVLYALEGNNTRPTTARVKEDMFNIINNFFIFKGKVSLDLFAGTGSLSIEGVSRGVAKAYINDKYHLAIEVIKKNLASLKGENFIISMRDWKECLTSLKDKVDIIYFDPPFSERDYYYQFLEIICEGKILNKNGVVSIQAEFPVDLTNINLTILKEKKYKNKFYYLLRKE